MKRSILLLFTVFSSLFTLASSEKFIASVSSTTVAVGQQFQIKFELNASGSSYTPPDLSNFRVYSGPNQSSSMQFINGHMSSSISYSYILAPKTEGQITIGPAKIKADGNWIESNTITLTVTAGQHSAQTSAQNGNQQQQAQNSENNEQLSFIKVTASRTSTYQGEEVLVTYKLYSRGDVVDIGGSKLPNFNGFWEERIDIGNNIQFTSKEVINGVEYLVADWYKAILYPQRSGKITIDPMTATLVIQKQTGKRRRSLFDQFFGGYENVELDVATKPLTIDVKPLPNGKPANFDGAVGQYKFAVEADHNKVKANEAINLKVTISGNGSLKLLKEPLLELPSDFEVYDPKTKDNTKLSEAGMSGTKEFNYLIIPRVKGEFTIDPISFSYFDPKTRAYKMLKSDPIKITVEAGDESTNVTYSKSNKQELDILNNDIRYIKTDEYKIKPKETRFYGTFVFYLLFILLLLAFPVLYFTHQKYMSYNSDTLRVKSDKASKIAQKRLAIVKTNLDKGETAQFYENLLKALQGYLSDKFAVGTSDMNKEHIKAMFTSKKLNAELINTLIDLWDKCEMARYAPGSADSEAEIYKKAAMVLTTIENTLKS